MFTEIRIKSQLNIEVHPQPLSWNIFQNFLPPFPGTNPLWWTCFVHALIDLLAHSSCSFPMNPAHPVGPVSSLIPSLFSPCLASHPALISNHLLLLDKCWLLVLPTGRGIEIFSCGTVSRKHVIPQRSRMLGFKS